MYIYIHMSRYIFWCWWTGADFADADELMLLMHWCCWFADSMMQWCYWCSYHAAVLILLMHRSCRCADAADVLLRWSCWCTDVLILQMRWYFWCTDALILLMRWCNWIRIRSQTFQKYFCLYGWRSQLFLIFVAAAKLVNTLPSLVFKHIMGMWNVIIF